MAQSELNLLEIPFAIDRSLHFHIDKDFYSIIVYDKLKKSRYVFEYEESLLKAVVDRTNGLPFVEIKIRFRDDTTLSVPSLFYKPKLHHDPYSDMFLEYDISRANTYFHHKNIVSIQLVDSRMEPELDSIVTDWNEFNF